MTKAMPLEDILKMISIGADMDGANGSTDMGDLLLLSHAWGGGGRVYSTVELYHPKTNRVAYLGYQSFKGIIDGFAVIDDSIYFAANEVHNDKETFRIFRVDPSERKLVPVYRDAGRMPSITSSNGKLVCSVKQPDFYGQIVIFDPKTGTYNTILEEKGVITSLFASGQNILFTCTYHHDSSIRECDISGTPTRDIVAVDMPIKAVVRYGNHILFIPPNSRNLFVLNDLGILVKKFEAPGEIYMALSSTRRELLYGFLSDGTGVTNGNSQGVEWTDYHKLATILPVSYAVFGGLLE
jgi:hypothetical protein